MFRPRADSKSVNFGLAGGERKEPLMPMPSPCPCLWNRVRGGLVALALIIGMRSPAVPQVPDPTGKAEQTADPLSNLNNASRMFYTLAKQQTLARSGPVLIVIGDDLVLRKGE